MEVHRNRKRRASSLDRLVQLAVLCLLVLAKPSQARTWYGPAVGWWNQTTYWEGMRDPDTGEDVWIVDTIVSGPKLLYYMNPYATHTPTFRRLVINSNYGIPTEVWQGHDELRVQYEEVGANGKGKFYQYGGLHSVLEILSLGSRNGSWGGYELSDGELHVYGIEYIGYSGDGDFLQRGGQHTVDDGLYLAWSSDVTGAYVFGLGNLDTDKTVVGYGGQGDFYQDNGTYHTTDALMLGDLKDATGTYECKGGRVNTQTTTIGYSGDGTFEQTDGIHDVAGNMYVGHKTGSTGFYNITDGHNRIDRSLYLGYESGADGTYTNEGGSLTAYDIYVGYGGHGLLSLNKGGTSTVERDLYIGYSAGSDGSCGLYSGTLYTDSTYVGFQGDGLFDQMGGSHLVENTLYINGDDSNFTTDYKLSGGLLSVEDEIIGVERGAWFSQRGVGTHEVRGTLAVGLQGDSEYSLYGGQLSVMNEQLGLDPSAEAAFMHCGGTHTVQNSLYVGHTGTAVYGLVNMGDISDTPSLTAQAEIIGFAPGSEGLFRQGLFRHDFATFDCGDHLVHGSLTLGAQRDQDLGAAYGTYDLESGNLTVEGDLFIGDEGVGEFLQYGGTHTTAFMYLGFGPSGVGTYTLGGTGVLDTDVTAVGVDGTGTFTQVYSTHTTNTLLVGTSAGAGTYNMKKGRLTVSDTLQIGDNGTMTVSGGSVKTDTLTLSDSGTFDLLSGTFMAGSIIGSLTNSAGALSRCSSAGMLTVAGSYTQLSDASLLMELGGLTRGDEYAGASPLYDSLLVSDTLTLGGTLDVVWWDGFSASEGDVFDIFDWGTLAGHFDTIYIPDLADGLFWDTGSLYVDGSLAVVSSLNPGPGPATVPLPGAILLCAAGLTGFRAIRGRLR